MMSKEMENQAAETAVAVEEEDTLEGMYLTFPLGKEEYGIEIRYVIEIVGIQKITEVPDMPPFIKGVINLRGKVIPVMDVRLRFDLEEKEYTDQTCIIVIDIGGTSVGLIVDTVSEVMCIPEENIDPPPRIRKDERSQFIKGLGKVEDSVKILLDVPKLLFDERVEQDVEAMA